MYIINVSVSVVVNAVVRHFLCIGPYILSKVFVLVVNARINYGNNRTFTWYTALFETSPHIFCLKQGVMGFALEFFGRHFNRLADRSLAPPENRLG